MTRVLFLDDQPQRAAAFRSKYRDMVWVTTSAEAIEQLRASVWDLICLDYDLGDGDCGLAVAAWMLGYFGPGPLVVVHSTNLYGAAQMLRALRPFGALYVPFTFAPGGPFNL